MPASGSYNAFEDNMRFVPLTLVVALAGCTGSKGGDGSISVEGQNTKTTIGKGSIKTESTQPDGKKVSTELTNEVDVSRFGNLVYPGSSYTKKDVVALRQTGSTNDILSMRTADPVDKIETYYKGKLPGATVAASGSATTYINAERNGERVSITVIAGKQNRVTLSMMKSNR